MSLLTHAGGPSETWKATTSQRPRWTFRRDAITLHNATHESIEDGAGAIFSRFLGSAWQSQPLRSGSRHRIWEFQQFTPWSARQLAHSAEKQLVPNASLSVRSETGVNDGPKRTLRGPRKARPRAPKPSRRFHNMELKHPKRCNFGILSPWRQTAAEQMIKDTNP